MGSPSTGATRTKQTGNKTSLTMMSLLYSAFLLISEVTGISAPRFPGTVVSGQPGAAGADARPRVGPGPGPGGGG